MAVTFREYFTRHPYAAGLNAEAQVFGKPQLELEYTIFAELDDLDAMKNAFHVEEHEQWRVPFESDAEVRARIRATNNREWVLTTKETSDEWVGAKETNTLLTKESFDIFKKVACDGYMKTRHCFRCEGSDLIWEVDVFRDRLTGQPSLWVKMDLEVKDMDQEIPKPPFKVKDFVVGGQDGAPMSDRMKIRALWDNRWARLDEVDREKDTE